MSGKASCNLQQLLCHIKSCLACILAVESLSCFVSIEAMLGGGRFALEQAWIAVLKAAAADASLALLATGMACKAFICCNDPDSVMHC